MEQVIHLIINVQIAQPTSRHCCACVIMFQRTPHNSAHAYWCYSVIIETKELLPLVERSCVQYNPYG